ncbi:MAG: pyridoxal-phosphate dependent enzyme [Bacteroidota bacterium]|nr:pyridoxal-phosphate dependent enzyme [Bacteroidota bacterium]
MKIESQEISLPILQEKNIRLFIKRLDKVHPFVSGNKWFKLRYNLIEAKKLGYKTLLTFGGAYSNHIVATAFAAKENGFQSIGIIRGEQHLPLNPTLYFAKENGMELHYVNRSDYRLKGTAKFLEKLNSQFGYCYFLPEGGTNELAIKGAEEILGANDTQDYVCCAIGTGGTIAGIINSSNDKQTIIGFPSIKGFSKLAKDIKSCVAKENYQFINTYTGGGYAKVTQELVKFINDFYLLHNIPLDAIYTGKMMMGVLDLVSKDYFPKGSTILTLHTGGLQGNKGISERLGIRFFS